MQVAPMELRNELRDEIKAWLKINNMWSSANGVALSAILEWRLQELGYSLWGDENDQV